MSCDDCRMAREVQEHRVYDPRCIHCGARYIQALNTWPRRVIKEGFKERDETRDERKEWRQKVVADWVAQGHSEQELLQLATSEKVPFEPIEKKGKSK